MRKFIALFLVIAFMGMNCATYERGEGISLEPDQKPGIRLVIQEKDDQQVRGELIAVKENSLLLKESDSGSDLSVDIKDIRTITIGKDTNFQSSVLFGLIMGAGFGAVSGIASGDDDPGLMSFTAEDKALMYGAALGLIGVVMGGIFGVMSGADKTIRMEGKSEAEIKKILEDLRKKARVPNFQ